MFKTLSFIFLLFSSISFGQEAKKPEAYKFVEFGRVSEKVWKEKFVNLLKKLDDECADRILFVFHGRDRRVSKESKRYLDYLNSKIGCDPGGRRIKVIKGKNQAKFRTEIWIQPLGADDPNLDLESGIQL